MSAHKSLKCHYCNEDTLDFLTDTYELKKGGTVDVCVVCENDAEIYFDKIKRECLIDGESLEVTREDEKEITREKRLRHRKEEEERVFDCDKSIFYFSNEPLRKPEY